MTVAEAQGGSLAIFCLLVVADWVRRSPPKGCVPFSTQLLSKKRMLQYWQVQQGQEPADL